MEMIELSIDNKVLRVKKGTTILKAARKVGIEIPTLCHMELHNMNIENKPGSCRVCVVEVDGRRNLAPRLHHRSDTRHGSQYPYSQGAECP
jgi:NADP-reducing hydrogenase subunit HndD